MEFDQPRGVEWEFGAADPSPCSSRPRMPLFKKSKKSRQPSQKIASLGIPTHIAVGPLGISADLAPEISSEGAYIPSCEIHQPMGLILLPRQVQTTGGDPVLYFETVVWINDSTHRVLRPRLLDVRMILHVGTFYCN